MRGGSSSASGDAVIAVLSDVVRNQIAAGEVIERPASVVKELLENALDAGATHVRIDLEEGGAKLVRVLDDGCGMNAADLALAFAAHATSKLRTTDDLDHIASLGFRGEALASIGSVARARIFSRPAGAETGCAVENEGGRVGEPREAGGARGTEVVVRDLFYNTPARRRFLKRTATELSRCLDVIQRAALAHDGVGFVATHDGRRLFDVEASMGLAERVRRTFGAELADALVGVDGGDGEIRVAGYVAPPRFARRDTSRQMWFLNGRPLRDKVLVRCLKEAFRGWIPDGGQPCAFLRLSMPPELVDVNVHPTKSEVRFREDRRLFGFLVRVLKGAVARTDVATPGASMLESARRRGGWQPAPGAPAQRALPDPGPEERARAPHAAAHERDRAAAEPLRVFEVPGPIEVEPDAWSARDELRGPFLQIARTYIVRPLADGFEIIDQHALHERLTLEGLERDLAAGRVEMQRALVPELVELARDEVRLLEDWFEELAKGGIELAAFGPTTIAVHGLPARLRNPDPAGLVRDLVAWLREQGRAPTPRDVLERALHSAACRSSIMAGDPLTESEMRSLLERAAEHDNDQTCAHGRPTRVRFTLSDLEKAFHRR